MTVGEENKTIARPDWLQHEVWPYRIRTTQAGGYDIAYTDEGVGPTLLMVHDGMWSFVWGQLIEPLKSRFRVLTLDFPGAGLSPAVDRPATLEGDSMVLEGMVDRLALEEITLVVHDLGGAVGLGLAGRRPELIKGLVLVNTFAWEPDGTGLRAMLRTMGSTPVTNFDTATNLVPRLTSGRFGVGRHLNRSERRAFLGGFRDKGRRRRFHELMGSALREGRFLSEVEAALDASLAGKPALTVYGRRNDPFGFQERFSRYFDDVEEMVVAGGYHFPMADDPTGVAARIAGWHREKFGH